MKPRAMLRSVAAGALTLAMCAATGVAAADEIVVTTGKPDPLEIRDCRLEASQQLRCRVVNQSSAELRDVQLAVRREYLWAKEFHPGEQSPGWSAILSLPEPIPPRSSVTFTYPGRFSDAPGGGRFRTSVEVMGYTELYRDGRSS